MMGLMLHTNAKQLITGQNYQDALEVLSMGEVSYWCLFATDSFVFKKFHLLHGFSMLVIAAMNMFLWEVNVVVAENFQ